MSKVRCSLRVNGRVHELAVEPDEPLLWVLRDELRLTGTKFGCGEGDCGACSVLIDGVAWRSCQVTAASLSASEAIVTIEGLGQPGNLSPVQRAFLEHNAFGCGFCTPGMIVNATALLDGDPGPDREAIVEAMNDNLCRCAAYPRILEAIESVAAGSGKDES